MEDRTYLTLQELDFRSDECVTELGDGRYVVATDDGGSETTRPAGRPERRTDRGRPERRTDRDRPERRTDRDRPASDRPATNRSETPDAGRRATRSRRDPPERDESAYFVSLAARTDEGTFDTRIEGDDIGAVCASMLRWYARRVSPHDDPQKVLSVLLSRAELDLTDPAADR